MAEPRTGVAPVALYTESGYPLEVGQAGEGYTASCQIEVADTTAADAAIFSMKLAAGGKSAYIKAIYGDVVFSNAAVDDGEQGIYFERHSGRLTLTHASSTAITPVGFTRDEQSSVYDCRFYTAALTATGVDYEGAKFGRKVVAISGTPVNSPFYFAYGSQGLKLNPGQGLAMRLAYQASAGLFVALNVDWVEV